MSRLIFAGIFLVAGVSSAAAETRWYRDADGDGVGTAHHSLLAVTRPAGHVARSGDCDDQDATVAPGRVEVCDGLDNDCDGRADNGCVDLGACPSSGAVITCDIDVLTGSASCNGPSPLTVSDRSPHGPALAVDMTGFRTLLLELEFSRPDEWAFHLGNSPGNDGWSGDRGEFEHDSELFTRFTTLFAFANDHHRSEMFKPLANALGANSSQTQLAVCDGYFQWRRGAMVHEVAHPGLLRFGNPDLDGGHLGRAGNDNRLWLGLNRTIRPGRRVGSGVESVRLYLIR